MCVCGGGMDILTPDSRSYLSASKIAMLTYLLSAMSVS